MSESKNAWTYDEEYQSAERKMKTGRAAIHLRGEYVGEVKLAYAADIVSACNSHDALLEALKAIYNGSSLADKQCSSFIAAERAIRKAEGREQP